jgi:hypothetical protein
MKFRNTFQSSLRMAHSLGMASPLGSLRTAGMLGMSSMFVMALSLGCAEKVEDAGPEKEELPNIKVELPASPNFDEARAPVKWEGDPDSAYSIYGLRKDIDDRLKEGEAGQQVVVKGWVQEIYVPPVCPEGQLCPPGKQPHFWITDNAEEKGKKRAMMVVNYHFPIPEWDTATQEMWAAQPLVVVELGKQYTIKGTFKRVSDTGFAHDSGLLEFNSYKAPNPDPESGGELIWIYPPNCDWHPQTVAAQEAENAEMQARMQKDAADLAAKKAGGGDK